MGRPYAEELDELDRTYEWGMRAPIDDLSRSIGRCGHAALSIIGSGGSLTAAHFAALLHTQFTGHVAQVQTPYEFATSPRSLLDSSLLICSAGGNNPDVLAGAQVAVKRTPLQLLAITMRSRSKLQTIFAEAGWPQCHAFSAPTPKDGFLATNSLLATALLLLRAYETWAGVRTCLPKTLGKLLHAEADPQEHLKEFRRRARCAMERSTLIVLHGLSTKPAAMDMESRFTEAALASIQPADYRNFAHGRHHWLARHPSSSAVIAFSVRDDKTAKKTLSLLPRTIPQCEITVEAGLNGSLAAIGYSILLAQIAGDVKKIDPGRPHVPMFGRKLYHLKAMPRLCHAATSADERVNLAVERKSRYPVATLAVRGDLDRWVQQYRTFIGHLGQARIRAVVIDYDGTLCAPQSRLLGPSDQIIRRLKSILDAGVTIAVATGRGKSVRETLRKRLTSSQHRAHVVVGYHNGAEIGSLADTSCPPADQPLAAELIEVANALRGSSVLQRHAAVEAKGRQITVEFLPDANGCAVLAEVVQVCRIPGSRYNLSIATSSHSIDVIPAAVSKSNVVRHLINSLGLDDDAASILCIGDRGRPPGNDADLLRHPLSLSVDEVNGDPATCWSLAKPESRFDVACLEYLTRLHPVGKALRFDTKGLLP
ncbi:MAG: HAD hydrolase family protein [Phycisphaerales bacterium]|nr:HAD hydrolase family protein [Phycisphaerales bacterium]